MKTYKIITLGCKVNQYESYALEEILNSNGYKKVDKGADIGIIHTCTVTASGDRKSRQWIGRFKRENPECITVIMGCYVQLNEKELVDRDDVDIVIGTMGKEKIIKKIEDFKVKGKKGEIYPFEKTEKFSKLSISQGHERTRATLKVQDGCNQYCSYCIIPYARGPIRSAEFKDIKKELINLAAADYKEVVITGIHLASYKDKDKSLMDIIELAQNTQGIERIRLSSLEPNIITEEFVRKALKNDKLCDHFHLSLQSGSDSVLKRMNRKYNTSEYMEAIKKLRKAYPNLGLTTDIIIGFPGETDKEWMETLEFVKKVKFSKIHIFSYSPREGTVASKMKGQVHGNIVKKRYEELSELAEKLRGEFLKKQIGQKLSVLTEVIENDGVRGYSKNYTSVFIPNENRLNEIIPLEISDINYII